MEVIINLLDYFNNNKELIEQKKFTNEEKTIKKRLY